MRAAAPWALALLAVAGAHAGIEIEAQSAQYDEESQVFRFSGNVIAAGDSISMQAESLEVRANGGDQRYRATGSPARIRVGAAAEAVSAAGAALDLHLPSGRLVVTDGSLALKESTVRAGRIVRDGGALQASGAVRLGHEGMEISGDELDAGGGEDGRVLVTGRPASVAGTGDAHKLLNATALTVMVLTRQRLVELSGGAVAQSGTGELAGDTIVYNISDSTFVATGGRSKRVKVVMDEGGTAPAPPAETESPGGGAAE